MFPIFKLNHVINNRISKIYIFHGNQPISLDEGFANINKKYNLFTEEEYNFIQSNNIEISYINKLIHPDDTIIRIKEKIFNEIKDIDICLNELYLFSLYKKHDISGARVHHIYKHAINKSQIMKNTRSKIIVDVNPISLL